VAVAVVERTSGGTSRRGPLRIVRSGGRIRLGYFLILGDQHRMDLLELIWIG